VLGAERIEAARGQQELWGFMIAVLSDLSAPVAISSAENAHARAARGFRHLGAPELTRIHT